MCTIILCAGNIDRQVLPIGTNNANAMVPISGKPVIGWIIDDLIAKNIDSVTIVLNDIRLQRYVERVYGTRVNLNLVKLSNSPSILHSLQAGLVANPDSQSVRVILGDTLIRDSYDSDDDFLYVGAVDMARNWCVVSADTNGKITNFFDKQENEFDHCLAAAGYYHLTDKALFSECLDVKIAEGRRELSAVLQSYMEARPLYQKEALQWFDFGHIDNLVDARFRLLSPRYFNSVKLDSFSHTITKRSSNNTKLHDELMWYLDLPKPLQRFTPRLFEYDTSENNVYFTQEFYGYPTLAELYLFSDLKADTWRYAILRTLFRIHAEFRKYPGKVDPKAAHSVYITKTFDRLEQMRKQDDLGDLLTSPEIILNGKSLRNIDSLTESIQSFAVEIAQSVDGCVIHGDFCFSNILFDVGNLIVRLIDPRGSFGRPGIFGDPRYDIAKLRHSIVGCYDYIVSDLFRIHGEGNSYEAQIFSAELVAEVSDQFNRLVVEYGYDLREIIFIEGLLFVSMVPLHHGHMNRQKMMYLTGIHLLNQVL